MEEYICNQNHKHTIYDKLVEYLIKESDKCTSTIYSEDDVINMLKEFDPLTREKVLFAMALSSHDFETTNFKESVKH